MLQFEIRKNKTLETVMFSGLGRFSSIGWCDDILKLSEIPTMKAVKVDDAHRVRLPMLAPGDYYFPKVERMQP